MKLASQIKQVLSQVFSLQVVVLMFLALLPGTVMLTCFTPFFNNTDSGCMYNWNISSHFPHWQPGYLFFLRIINMLVTCSFNPAMEVPVSWVSIYLAVALQHIVAASGLVFFACRLSGAFLMRLITLLVVGTLSPFYFAANGIFLESLQGGLLLLLLGMLVGFLRTGVLGWFEKVCIPLSLLLLSLIRHESFVYGVLIIFTALIWLRYSSRLERRRQAIMLLGMFVLPVVISISFNSLLKRYYDVRIKNIVGRAGIYFIYDQGSIISNGFASDAGKQELARRMAERSDDEVLKKVIPLMFKCNNAWLENYERTREVVRAEYPGIIYQDEVARADALLEKFFYLYVKTVPLTYLEQVSVHLKTYLVSSPDGVWFTFIGGTASFLQSMRNFSMLLNTQLPFDEKVWEQVYLDAYYNSIGHAVLSKYPPLIVLAMSVLLSALFLWRFVKDTRLVAALLPCLVVVVTGQLLAVSCAQPVITRYAVGAWISMAAGICIVLSLAHEEYIRRKAAKHD